VARTFNKVEEFSFLRFLAVFLPSSLDSKNSKIVLDKYEENLRTRRIYS